MIGALWSRFSSWLIGAALALAALAAIYFKGRSAGKAIEQQKTTERELEQERAKATTIQEAHDVESNIVQLPDSAVRERLRDKWTRD